MVQLVLVISECVKENTSPHSSSSLNVSVWIAIITLLFAVFTYWFDQYEKRKIHKETIKLLLNELRFLYRVVCIDIVKYKKVKESNYRSDFFVSVYTYPIIKHLIAENKFHKYFKGKDYFIGMNIYQSLTQIENPNKTGFTPPINPEAIDWFFENRLKELRGDLLNLVSNGQLIKDLQADRELHRVVHQFISSL
jgi:hypothetical protein